MNRILIVAAMLALLAACKPQEETTTPAASTEAATPAAQPARPAGTDFQAPLPQGVVLTQPHNVRLDVPAPNPNGSVGRRVEFEYLDGDAPQAMREFSEAMAAAGFVSPEGPVVENGVVRQAFKKPGYGAVFARAQEEDAAAHKHELARGFVVVAWPAEPVKDPSSSN